MYDIGHSLLHVYCFQLELQLELEISHSHTLFAFNSIRLHGLHILFPVKYFPGAIFYGYLLYRYILSVIFVDENISISYTDWLFPKTCVTLIVLSLLEKHCCCEAACTSAC